MQNNPVLNGRNDCSRITTYTVLFLALFPALTHAAKWTIDPSLSVRETYSDNINLDSNGEESAFVTTVTPQVSVKGEGSRLKLNLNYRMQNIFRSNGDNGDDTNHQLQADALAELIENLFFLDANGSMGQANTNATGRRSGDNISGSSNSNDFWTAGFSPYITPHLNGYADGEVRYRFNTVHSDGTNASNSDIHEQSVALRSGPRFSYLTWNVNHSNREQKRTGSSSSDTQFKNTNGEIRLGLTRKFSVFVQAGNYDSDFVGSTGQNSNNNNGSYTTYGGAWTPSRRFSLEGGIGSKNSFVTVNMAPTTRTSWVTTFRDSDVGTNTGETWNTLLSLKTRRTTWKAIYAETVSTYQQTLLEQGFLVGFDPSAGALVLIPIDIPTAIDEVFTQQRGELSFTGNTGKSTVNLRTYTTKRHYQESGNNQDVLGWNASWNWRMSAITNSILSFRWQKTEGDNVVTAGVPSTTNSDQTYKSASLVINRRLTTDASANISLLRAEQNSDDSATDYVENRITAGITVNF